MHVVQVGPGPHSMTEANAHSHENNASTAAGGRGKHTPQAAMAPSSPPVLDTRPRMIADEMIRTKAGKRRNEAMPTTACASRSIRWQQPAQSGQEKTDLTQREYPLSAVLQKRGTTRDEHHRRHEAAGTAEPHNKARQGSPATDSATECSSAPATISTESAET